MQIQNNKQVVSSLKVKNANKAADAHGPGAVGINRIIARWSNDDIQLAVQGMRTHGKDFQKIAEIMGTKNESQINQFYSNNRKKYGLDEIIKTCEAKKLQEQQQKQKLNEAQQKVSTNATNSDVKNDLKKSVSDDEIMEVSNCIDVFVAYNYSKGLNACELCYYQKILSGLKTVVLRDS